MDRETVRNIPQRRGVAAGRRVFYFWRCAIFALAAKNGFAAMSRGHMAIRYLAGNIWGGKKRRKRRGRTGWNTGLAGRATTDVLRMGGSEHSPSRVASMVDIFAGKLKLVGTGVT